MLNTGRGSVYLAATVVLCLTLLQAQNAQCEIAPKEHHECADDTVQTSCHPAWEHTVAVRIDPSTLAFRDFLFDEYGYIASLAYAGDTDFENRGAPKRQPVAWIVRHRSALADVLEHKLLSFIRNSWSVHTRHVVAALLLIEDPYEAHAFIHRYVGASAKMFLKRNVLDMQNNPRFPSFIRSEGDSASVLTTAGYYAWMEMLHRIADNRSELAHALYDYPAEGFLEAA